MWLYFYDHYFHEELYSRITPRNLVALFSIMGTLSMIYIGLYSFSLIEKYVNENY